MIAALVTLFAMLAPQSEDLVLIIKFCRDVDRDSWAWWYHMCWLYEGLSPTASNTLAGGLSTLTAIGAAKILRWVTGRRVA